MRILSALAILIIPMGMAGQVVIDQSDMPEPGDTIRKSHSVNIGWLDFEAAGPGYTWDFSSLVPFYQTVDTFVSVNQTPFLYQIFFFLTSNLAKKQTEFDQFQGFQLTDSYSFYKNSASSFQEVGFGVTINGIPLPTLFEEPDVIYHFPLSAGDIDSSSSSYSFDIPGIGFFGGWKHRKNTVDGWGYLTTSFGTFETLRLKSEIVQFDSIYIDSLGFGIPVYQEMTEYKWLGKDKGQPLCEVIDNGIYQTVSYMDSLRNVFTGLGPNNSYSGIEIFPNPTAGSISILMKGIPGQDFRVDLLDATGNVVLSRKGYATDDPLVIDLSPYKRLKGMYILVFQLERTAIMRKLIIL